MLRGHPGLAPSGRLAWVGVVTLGELRKGIGVLEDRGRAARLEVWLETAIPAQFADRILPFDAAVADRWGRLIAAMKRRGTAVSAIDPLIAATALHHNLSLVTRNEKNFAASGVSTANPWAQVYRH